MPKSLRRSLALIHLGLRAGVRNAGVRVGILSGAVITGAWAFSQGELAGSAAIVLSAWLARVYGVAACLWFAYTGIRDRNEREGAAIRAKPMDGAEWVLVNWATGLITWWILLGAAFAAAAIAQVPAAGIASLEAHGIGYLRALSVLSVMATLAFSLTRLMGSPLGGILVVFAWFCLIGGVEFLPPALRPDYSQNRWLFIPAALCLLAIAALIGERWRRGEFRRPMAPIGMVLLLLALTGLGAWRSVLISPERDPTGLAHLISLQHLVIGSRVPGFWLPDNRGGIARLAPDHGKILLVYLFAADDLEAARTLPALQAIDKEFGSRGVQPVTVCLSPDQEDGWTLANTTGYSYVIASDLQTLKSGPIPMSPVASAYNAQLLPLLAITDRRRQLVESFTDPSYDFERLRAMVNRRLESEPE